MKTEEEIAELYGAMNALSEAMDHLHEKRMDATKKLFALNQMLREQALDKKAENARELGLDYAPTWAGLTDEEIQQLSNKWKIIYGGHVGDFAYEIETKLKEKNT